MLFGRYYAAFQRNLLPLSSGWERKRKVASSFEMLVPTYLNNMVSYYSKQEFS
jgi:hypothetical protein